jgi:hypothetical protein
MVREIRPTSRNRPAYSRMSVTERTAYSPRVPPAIDVSIGSYGRLTPTAPAGSPVAENRIGT